MRGRIYIYGMCELVAIQNFDGKKRVLKALLRSLSRYHHHIAFDRDASELANLPCVQDAAQRRRAWLDMPLRSY